MYEVIHEFLDLQDGSYHYKVGEIYPRTGVETTLERATELIGTNNKIGVPLIREIMTPPVEEKPKKRTTKTGK